MGLYRSQKRVKGWTWIFGITGLLILITTLLLWEIKHNPKHAHAKGVKIWVINPIEKNTLKNSSTQSLENSTFHIPSSAVFVDINKRQYVWVVDPKRMIIHRREINGREYSPYDIQVSQGLKEGELIIENGVTNMYEGMKVKISK